MFTPDDRNFLRCQSCAEEWGSAVLKDDPTGAAELDLQGCQAWLA